MPRLLLHAAAALALATGPLAALADGNGSVRAPHASEAPAPRSAERAACVPSGPFGQVVSLSGDARAVGPDGSSRMLACDDSVNGCDQVVTGPGGSVSLLLGEAVAQIGPDSAVGLSARPAPELALERGGVRVVDPRDQASDRVQLYTPALSASTGRGDAELTRDGDAVRLCAHDEPVVALARDGATTVPAGGCLATSVLGGMQSAPAGAPSIALGDVGSCPFRVAGLPGLIPPVASPPPAGPGIEPFDAPGRDSCDTPGSGCAAVCQICDDPDPGTGCGFPGSPCED
jgi:hypothetical protein